MPRLIDERTVKDPRLKKKVPIPGRSLFLDLYVDVPHTGIGRFDLEDAVKEYGEESLQALEVNGFVYFDCSPDRSLYFIPSYFQANLKNLAQNGIPEKYVYELTEHQDSPLGGVLYRKLREQVSESKYKEVFVALNGFAARNPLLTKAWDVPMAHGKSVAFFKDDSSMVQNRKGAAPDSTTASITSKTGVSLFDVLPDEIGPTAIEKPDNSSINKKDGEQ